MNIVNAKTTDCPDKSQANDEIIAITITTGTK